MSSNHPSSRRRDSAGSAAADTRRLRALLEHSWDITKLLNSDSMMLYVSPASERILGIGPEMLTGRPLADELHPEDAPDVLAHFGQLVVASTNHLTKPNPVILTYRSRCADGSYRWMEGVFTNLLDEPEVAAIVLNERDVTDRRRAQADRDELLLREQQARAQAEAASRAKDSFLSIVSHELRTPLTPVLLCVSDLQRDDGLSARAREELAMIREQVELEAQIIDDLLDLTRIGQGRLHLQPVSLDAHQILRESLAECARDFRDKQLDVRLDLDATCSQLSADSRRLRQIFRNVLTNAAKFTPAAGTILLRTEDGPDCRFRLTITDSGIGFRPDVVDKLFLPFEQAEQSLTRRFGGLGLGLTIAKELVDLHCGSISASSQGPDQGATFTLEFPASQAQSLTAGDPQPRELRLNILLVEDNPQTLTAMMRLLQHDGHRVHTSNTIDSALRTLEDQDIDLLLCDIGLPDGSGWELLRRASAFRTVPAVAISGFGSDEDIDRSRRAGFGAHVVKPITPQKLRDAIQQVTPSLHLPPYHRPAATGDA